MQPRVTPSGGGCPLLLAPPARPPRCRGQSLQQRLCEQGGGCDVRGRRQSVEGARAHHPTSERCSAQSPHASCCPQPHHPSCRHSVCPCVPCRCTPSVRWTPGHSLHLPAVSALPHTAQPLGLHLACGRACGQSAGVHPSVYNSRTQTCNQTVRLTDASRAPSLQTCYTTLSCNRVSDG